MIAHLRGTIGKSMPGEVSIDVAGVGYRLTVPLHTWDALENGSETQLFVSTYVREDRLDLFGFADDATRILFEQLIALQGVGPRMGLELCSVPHTMLLKAVFEEDPAVLTSIKGVGKKTAEKLLLELKSLMERQPHIFSRGGSDATRDGEASYDQDTIAALSQLGFSPPDIAKVLKGLPKDLTTTEERVTAALRAL